MKLNIGSHNVRLPGFLNVDILPLQNADFVGDITEVPWVFDDLRKPEQVKVTFVADGEGKNGLATPILDESVEEIVLVEVLEHISFHDTHKVLSEMYRVLKPGGKIHIQVPDCGSMMEMYVRGEISEAIPHKPESVEQVMTLRNVSGGRVHPRRWLMAFCGAQKYGVPDIHKNIFTKQILQDNLEEAGFEKFDFKEDPLGWKIKVNVFK